MISCGVDESIAAPDACRIEHAISDDTFEKLKECVTMGVDKETVT